jgi:ParB family chromosome partitioning protein
MATKNHAPTAIAQAFGCTVIHVKRRLKLANLPPATLAALRENTITLEAESALTLCATSEQHSDMLEIAKCGSLHPSQFKRNILGAHVRGTDRRAIYVGNALYAAEGGGGEMDLFTEQMIFEDEVLHDKLFKEKLTTAEHG